MSYVIGLDLGKKRDYTAVAVLQMIGDAEPSYNLIHLDRWRGQHYRYVVPKLQEIERRLMETAVQAHLEHYGYISGAIDPGISLLVDQTGVGEAVVNDVIRAAGISCHGITITSGTNVNRDGNDFRVPKRELVGRMEVIVENRRLAYPPAEQMPMVEALIAELDNFKATIKLTTGHDSYGAGDEWRDSAHDDMVLAVAMAVWYGEFLNEGLVEMHQTAATIDQMFHGQAGGYGSW